MCNVLNVALNALVMTNSAAVAALPWRRLRHSRLISRRSCQTTPGQLNRLHRQRMPRRRHTARLRPIRLLHTPPPLTPQAAQQPMHIEAGSQSRIFSLLCYVFPIIGGILFLLLAKDDRLVRFHAWQSIIASGALLILWLIARAILWPLALIVGLA